jgi:hypothetical protein
MNRIRAVAFALFAASVLAGCIPWRREALVQPALEIQVVDPDQRPVAGAAVLFLAASNPHHVLHHVLRLETDQQGRVLLEERRESETVYPLMMHGVPFYYWAWCVEKQGFVPAVREIHEPEAGPVQTLVLQPGASEQRCRQTGGRLSVE